MRGCTFDLERDNKWGNVQQREPPTTREDYPSVGARATRKVFEFLVDDDYSLNPNEDVDLFEEPGLVENDMDNRKTVVARRELKADRLNRKQKDKERGSFNAKENPTAVLGATSPNQAVLLQKIPPFAFKPKYRLSRFDQPEIAVAGEALLPEELEETYCEPSSLRSEGELAIPQNDSLDISSVERGSRQDIPSEEASSA